MTETETETETAEDHDLRTTTEIGRAMAESFNPEMEATLEARYRHLLPEMVENIVDFAYGRQYGRPGLSMRARCLATIAALTAPGGQTRPDQTRPELKINVAVGRKVGLKQREIAKVIWQMALYGGLPASINALNAAIEVFSQEETAQI